MTIKPKVKKFRIRRDGAPAPMPAPNQEVAEDSAESIAAALAAIGNEGLTARQLRMARRVAQKQGLVFTSDYDAVRQLRAAGIDPFQQKSVLELVMPDRAGDVGTPGNIQLPEKVGQGGSRSVQARGLQINAEHAREIREIQRDIVRRRRRKLMLMITRLSFFVFLPTFMVGWYFYTIATPMYATRSEIVIQQAQAQGGGPTGLSGLFQGTSMATQQDSIAVQSYLASREAMLRLDADHGFKDHFSDPAIDAIQRLPADATNEEAFKLFTKNVRISYDPTEGLIRMEVVAADAAKSVEFSQALIGYAEEQVDQLTSRLRSDQMKGALESYQDAERQRAASLAEWLSIQQKLQQIDSRSETAARMGQITSLEGEKQRLELVLQSRLNVERPSELQVQSLRDQIAGIETMIGNLRNQMTGGTSEDQSLAESNTELRTAEENYNFQTMILQQAQVQMEAARIEASRQVRYLSESVRPILPDAAAYPRAFENTLLAFLIFSGVYLMISITASILREQVSS